MDNDKYCRGCGEEKHDGDCDPTAAALIARIRKTEEFRPIQYEQTESGLALLHIGQRR